MTAKKTAVNIRLRNHKDKKKQGDKKEAREICMLSHANFWFLKYLGLWDFLKILYSVASISHLTRSQFRSTMVRA